MARPRRRGVPAIGRRRNRPPSKPGFPVETPPDLRSCKTGGTWDWYDATLFGSELDVLNTMVEDRNRVRLARQQLKGLMERALTGQLRFGDRQDVDEMRIEPAVLELRLNIPLQFPSGKHVLRVYFSEPLSRPRRMVIAKAAAKPASESGLGRQDDHIMEAYERLRNHLGLNV